MKLRRIAIVGSGAAPTFAVVPVSAIAATHANHRPTTRTRLDRSRDTGGSSRNVNGIAQNGEVSATDQVGSSADSSLDG